MRVIATYKLEHFNKQYPYLEQHVKTWYDDMINVDWKKCEDVMKYTNYANIINQNIFAFNILDYRIVVFFYPEQQALIVVDVLTDIEYEKLIQMGYKKSKRFSIFFWLIKPFYNFQRITTDKQCQNAIRQLEKILLNSMDVKYDDYAKNLCMLIHAFETQTCTIVKPDPVEAVKIRMFLK